MFKTIKKTTVFILAGLLLASTFAGLVGCGRTNVNQDFDFTETNQTRQYRFFGSGWQDFEGLSNDRVLQFLEAKFNVEIKITGSSKWQERLSTEIASNDTPDVFFSLPSESAYTEYIRKGVITEIGPYIERAEASNLKALLESEQFKDTTKINDKNYFIPQSIGTGNHAIYVRKDWMRIWNGDTAANGGRGKTGEALNDIPRTLSEFTSMLTYFAQNNLGVDGAKSYGLSLSNSIDVIMDFCGTFGISPDYYWDADGNVQLSALSDNYNDMLQWFKTGLSTGYIYPDFYTQSTGDNHSNFTSGRAGAMISTTDSVIDGILNAFRALDQDNYLDMLELIPMPDSDDGQYKGAFKGFGDFWGSYSISADTKEPMRLIRLLDYIFSPEGQKLLVYGVEGIHYTESNGVITPNNTERIADGVHAFMHLDDYKPNEAAGRYNIGYYIYPVPYKIENNRIVMNLPLDAFWAPDFVKKAYDICGGSSEHPLNYSALRNLISDGSINDNESKIMDAVTIYTLNIIANKNQTNERNILDGKLSNYKIADVLQYIKENNTK